MTSTTARPAGTGVRAPGWHYGTCRNKKESNMATYFASDGSYGDADDLITIDTSGWTEADWEKIEEASDSDRGAIAIGIFAKKKK